MTAETKRDMSRDKAGHVPGQQTGHGRVSPRRGEPPCPGVLSRPGDPDGLIGCDTPEALRAAAVRRVCTSLAAHCRVVADNLAYSIQMAEARGDDPAAARAELEALLDYEAAMVKRSGRDLPRYVPNALSGKWSGEKAA